MTGIDPHTSLAMTYLRAYIDAMYGRRGAVRKRKKAEHQLRMHWSVVVTTPRQSPEIVPACLNASDSSHAVPDAPNRLEGAFQPSGGTQ